jgi:2-polyprenyl-3-methyl-5-hydroxy-6-metoxy-1,4-benzoquinol methylase
VEAKLFDGDVPHVSTFEFHEHRERAPHLEQGVHQGRLYKTYALVQAAMARKRLTGKRIVSVCDLGCGDGGLLSLIKEPDTDTIGYDFQPSNVMGWVERGVNAYSLNFVERWDEVVDADVYVITECLEHLADPHGMVRKIFDRGGQIVCSSPWTETYASHDECHAWAWDQLGYTAMVTSAGFNVVAHETDGMFQIIWGIQ